MLAGDSEDCYEVRVDANGYIIAYGYADVDPGGYDSQYWLLKIRDNAAPAPGFLTGHVFEADGATPVQNVTVMVYDSVDVFVGTDSTDHDGGFFFTLNRGTYYADFTGADYHDTTLINLPIVAGETTAVSLLMYASGYAYLPGDANMYNGAWPPAVIGGDVTYLANYFRGWTSSQPCLLGDFWASADANGDCLIIGSDVTKLVHYFRGGPGILSHCEDYPLLWLTPDDLPAAAPVGWPNCE